MSADHLPEDIRRWPRDPYQILGIAPRCDPREARMAYAQLIRQFKPEQYPEHFRLIREAYDLVKRDAQYYGSVNPTADPAAHSPEAAAAHAAKGDSVDAVWSQACAGQEALAYSRLREMYQINAHGSELPARLYSLLLANPDLDPQRTPCDWLARGVLADTQWGPCRQLYRREIDDHPDEVLSERFEALLDTMASRRNILELLAWRWDVLARLGRTNLISADLANIATRLEREDEEGYVRVMLRAADFLAWDIHYDLDRLCNSIESHVHVHGSLTEDLSRLDFLRELSSGWQKLHKGKLGSTPLLRVLPLSWPNPYENRHRILSQCRVVADDPETALEQLDAIQYRAAIIPAHLGQTLGSIFHTAGDPREARSLLAVVNQHLGGTNHPVNEPEYGLYRWHLLRLCVAEFIAPETVANLHIMDRAAFVYQRIHDDWPLRTVCLAHRLIWA